MQKIWQQQVEWDQELPTNLRIAWEDYNTSLAGLNDIRVHRNVNIRNQASTFDLYGYGDASEAAYGACLNAVYRDKQGINHSELICARAKVAPLKTISLPRLESQAALLLAQLYNIVKRSCRDKINKVRLWSDSMITLDWIKTPPHLLKTFVANRVSKIQGLTEEATFLESCRSGRKATPLTAELERAERIILRWVQQEAFSVEIRYLQEGRPFPRKSQLRALSAYIDEGGLIRVGGRLQYAEIKSEQKNPIVLPLIHHVTSIILRDRHERLLYCPPEQLLHDVRQRFWPISGRREVRKIIKKCVKCYRINPTTMEIKMGELPAERIRSVDRPFTITGIDYAGPIQIRESKRRGRIHVSKGYVAVFVCTSTKAVHLKMVTDLSTDAFIATLQRFIARRGLCSQILSDSGTNFVGAAKHLKELYEFLIKEQKSIESELAEHRIEWRFIPPRAPHFGGLWEAAVKSTKKHLHTVTEGRVLTYEEYSTLLAQIEAVLNSWPLTPLSSDLSDLSVLTSAHFLIGSSLLQPGQKSHLDAPEGCLSRWQRVQKLSQLFWERWRTEYLQELQKRTKWTTSSNKAKEGDLVIIKEDNLPLSSGGWVE
ncbi:PREDICTED: uncharacterized protein LOC105556138 [Vollenhovia emeryi]|uniref:uncharacterized protein LOC105556138 n=1 Tax=Vollenhovia emeryi TaxID=411798 RepID=UPI0005F4A986|nr:PREDICTED: uncharacterized protein LOC105556138 [Vollenhovia emeryi]